MKKITNATLLNFIKANGEISSTRLATYFDVSPKTIKTKIKKINEQFAIPIIISSPKGYSTNSEIFPPLKSLTSNTDELIQTFIYSDKGVNKDDLADSLFMSLSTLEREIIKANQQLKDYELNIKKKDTVVFLVGTEENKRAWIRNRFYKETNSNFLDMAQIKSTYTDYDIEELKDYIIELLKNNNLYLNGYTLNSIMLHLVIAMQRSQNRQFMDENSQYATSLENSIAEKIAKHIDEKYAIKLPYTEIKTISMLINSRTTLLSFDLTDIEPRILNLTSQILAKINEHFLININNEDFYLKFSLHIQNLFLRTQMNQSITNPMTNMIKQNYPIIYDLAVFTSNEIEKDFNTTISEAEITYIAFHLGSYFEQSKMNEHKIQATLVSPNYYDLHLNLYEKISSTFEKDLVITKIVTEIDTTLQIQNHELILTTVQLNTASDQVLITPFLNHHDDSKIKEKITAIQQSQQKERSKMMLNKYFNEQTFFKNIHFNDKYEIINFLSENLHTLNYVQDSFEDEVLKRERLSSTAFGNNIAMPHSMETNANHSSISILLYDTPILWDKEYVQIVVLVAMSEMQKKEFRHIFELLITILSNRKNAKKLITSNTFDEFLKEIINFI